MLILGIVTLIELSYNTISSNRQPKISDDVLQKLQKKKRIDNSKKLKHNKDGSKAINSTTNNNEKQKEEEYPAVSSSSSSLLFCDPSIECMTDSQQREQEQKNNDNTFAFEQCVNITQKDYDDDNEICAF